MAFVLSAQSLAFAADKKETASFEEQHKDKGVIFLLFDVNINVNENWSYISRVHQKTKILKEEARGLGEIKLGYLKGRDKITVDQAYSITPDGRKHRYSQIQDLKNYDGYPVYSDSMIKVITLPEVNVGTVIDRQTTRISMGFSMENAFWYLFNFDFETPAKEVNFTITWPKKLNIQYKAFNLKYKPKIIEDRSTITYSWHLEDIYDSSDNENYLPLPTPENIGSSAEFSSIKNWNDIANWYYQLIQKNLKVNRQIEEATRQVIKDKTTIKDKTRAILEYIQDNFRYVSMSFGDNSLVPHPTDSVFKNKYGDCKDLSLLCMAMLKAVGINSSVALFNNEFSINDPKYDLPLPGLFDHVILLVEDKKNGYFYVDPLLDGYDIGEFPLSYQGAYTFIINGEGGRFDKFPVFLEERSTVKTIKNITLYEDASALFDSEYGWELSSAIDMRRTMKGMDKEAEQKYYQKLEAYLTSEGGMIERRIEGLDKKYGLLKGYVKYKKKDAFPLDGNLLIIDIAGYSKDLDFSKKERKNDIFYPLNSLDEEITTYKIPQGFTVLYLPNNINLKMGPFEIKREYKRIGNTITLVEIARLKRSQYPKEDYTKFKDFFDKLPSKTQQRIVLKKAKPWKKKLSEIIEIIKQ